MGNGDAAQEIVVPRLDVSVVGLVGHVLDRYDGLAGEVGQEVFAALSVRVVETVAADQRFASNWQSRRLPTR